MGIRHWIRKRLAEQADEGDDGAPSGSIISAIFGREPPTLHALGEYDQSTYPGELQDLLRRREDVAEELREMDLTTRRSRVDAIPRLQQMLRTYPHPLAYETLIHAYVDAGRWDEARGAAFAARARRTQVSRSPYSEIRAEIDRLKEWTPEEVDLLRQEREGTSTPAPAPSAEPTVTPVEMAAREELTEPVRQEEEVVAVLQAVSERPVEAAEPEASAEPVEPAPSLGYAEPTASDDPADPAYRTESARLVRFAEPVVPDESAGSGYRTQSDDLPGSAGMREPAGAGDSEEMVEPSGGISPGGADGAARRPNGNGGSRRGRRSRGRRK